MADRLALHGGTPVRSEALPYCRQTIDDHDAQAVLAALRSDWLTTGPRVEAFEQAVAALVGVPQAVAVNSGTAALHAAVFAAGIGPGDEVVTSPLTFVASANAVLYCGGTPVFADVRSDTLNLDPAAAEAACTDQTRAILHVDYAGQPGDIDRLGAIARRRGLILIEDAAHALGAEYRGQRVGSVADLTTFSFHPAKAITTGEGGMVTTALPDLATRVRRFRNHGLETDFRERGSRGDVYSPMTDLGYNYRLSDFQCALGLAQLGKLDHYVKRRGEIADRYQAAFGSVPGLTFPRVEPHVRHAWHIFPVLLDLEQLRADRREVLAALRAEGIGAAVHYVPAYWHPYYQRLGYPKGLCPVAERAFERLLTLPMFPAMADDDVDDVVAALAKVLRHFAR